jgi:hypothetical protein
MRIPSGKIDQSIYFVALDSADLTTRKTGLTGFTVYRSRNGAAPVVYTTPSISELSSSNMPGVYVLLIDEDTTVATNSNCEEYCVHITVTNMAPVTRTIELFRQEVDIVLDTGDSYTIRQLLRGLFSVLFAKWSKSGNTLTFRDISDTKNRVSADVTTSSRGAATLDLT